MYISVKTKGDGWEEFQRAVEELGSEAKARKTYRAVINKKGAELRREAVRHLPRQVGLPAKTIRKALGKPVRASNANLRYLISTKGGYIAAKYFKPKESNGGVTYFPRGKSVFIPQGFVFGGHKGNRKRLFMGRQVFEPLSGGKAGTRAWRPGATSNQWGRPMEKKLSDVRIPDEMQKGKTFDAYRRIGKELEPAIANAIRTLTKGAVT